jgi:hypothetical protein
MCTAYINNSFSLVLATTEAIAERIHQVGMRVPVPRSSFEERINKYQECLSILGYLGNTASATAIYKGRTKERCL